MTYLLLGSGEQWHRDQSGAGDNNSGNAVRWRMFLQQVGDRNQSHIHGERQKAGAHDFERETFILLPVFLIRHDR